MKECPICKEHPVVKGTGFCERHHRMWIQHLRKVKRDFIFREKKLIAVVKQVKEKNKL